MSEPQGIGVPDWLVNLVGRLVLENAALSQQVQAAAVDTAPATGHTEGDVSTSGGNDGAGTPGVASRRH